MKQPRELQSFIDRDTWRAWLAQNHATAKEICLIFYKRHTGKPGLTYVEALEEALCFGWIDGIVRRIDDQQHTIRFSPRRKNSIWSQQNKKRVGRLIQEGRMTEAGLAKVKEAKANGQWAKTAVREDTTLVPPKLTAALAENAEARRSFEKLAPCYRKQFLYWIGSAKRDETRQKRVTEAVRLLACNKRLGMG
jgi:uncharacterized protein YdeI (YjbR/CyaY-like superfamily)